MLHLVRHGRTAENAAGLLLGRADPPLDAVGRAQATALVAALPKPDRTLGSRVREACDALASLAADSEVVVVTHVSPLKASVAWALGVGDEVAWRLYVAPASITRIGVRDGRAVLRSFNEVAHLAELHSRG